MGRIGTVELLVIGVTIAGLIGVLLIRRRRTTAEPDSVEARMFAARRAAWRISRDVRRGKRGTLRGEGLGGSDSLAEDAAFDGGNSTF